MRLEGVWFRYARRADWVLRGVDVAVEPGSTVVVLGGNGVGKSTLLQLAAGVLAPDRGAVTGRPAVVGWVPERFPAGQPFTARHYLRRIAAVRGAPPAAVEAWADRLAFTPYLDVRLGALSKGTAQKVGLAQAMLVRPGLLVLDEPWEGLDAGARVLVPAIVAEVTAAGGAVLVSDHRGEIATLPDAVRWTLADGAVAAAGAAPAEVVVEIGVARADAEQTVARLRADGHTILGVRG